MTPQDFQTLANIAIIAGGLGLGIWAYNAIKLALSK